MITVREAALQDLDGVAPLFDAYRQFYGQVPDLALAKRFLGDRLKGRESIILVALNDAELVGFTQLFPSFSSTRAGRTFILNDLFVEPSCRRAGIGKLLLDEAARFAREKGAIRLSLSTAHTNVSAQRLYEATGWKLDEAFRTYSLAIGA